MKRREIIERTVAAVFGAVVTGVLAKMGCIDGVANALIVCAGYLALFFPNRFQTP
jgi:hypothetical protein